MEQVSKLFKEAYLNNKKVIAFTGHIGEGKNYVSSMITDKIVNTGYDVYRTAFASPLKKLVKSAFGISKVDSKDKDYYAIHFDMNAFINQLGELFINQLTSQQRPYGIYQFTILVNDVIIPELQLMLADREFEELPIYMKVRKLLQKTGELIRNNISKDFWAYLTVNRIQRCSEHIDYAVISDLRYMNEYNILKQTFGNQLLVVRVKSSISTVCQRLGISEDDYREMLKHESERDIDNIPTDFIIDNN